MKAAKLYEQSSMRGSHVAQYNLARLYQKGRGRVLPDHAKAFKFMLMAAQSGDAEAQYMV